MFSLKGNSGSEISQVRNIEEEVSVNHPDLPEEFLKYQDLYWETINNEINFENKDKLEEYLSSQEFSLVEFSGIQSELEMTDEGIEEVEKKFLEISKFLEKHGLSFREVLYTREIPQMIPEGTYFRILYFDKEKNKYKALPVNFEEHSANIFRKVSLANLKDYDEIYGDGREVEFSWCPHERFTTAKSFPNSYGTAMNGKKIKLDSDLKPNPEKFDDEFIIRGHYWTPNASQKGYDRKQSLSTHLHSRDNLRPKFFKRDCQYNGFRIRVKATNQLRLDGNGRFVMPEKEEDFFKGLTEEGAIALNKKIEALENLGELLEKKNEIAAQKLKEVDQFMKSELSKEEVAEILEATQGSELIDFSNKARKNIEETQEAVEKSILKKLRKTLSKSQEPEKIKDLVSEDLKSQYFLIAELLGEVGEYLKRFPNATQRELVMKFITSELKSKLSKTQIKHLIEGFLDISKKQKAIEEFFEANKENPNRALEENFGLTSGSLTGKIKIKKGLGTIQIYPEDFDDYSRLMKDRERARQSGGFATNEASIDNLKGCFTVIREADNLGTINHEDRHQHNKLTMVEKVFSYFLEKGNTSKFKRYLHRAKDEIIAQFRGQNRSLEMIISSMTENEGLYDYYYQNQKNHYINKIKSDFKKLKALLKADSKSKGFGMDSYTPLSESKEFKLEIPDDLASVEDMESLLEKFRFAKGEMEFRLEDRKIRQEDNSELIITISENALKTVKEVIENVEGNLEDLKNLKSGGEDWEKHKILVKKYIKLADKILKENPQEGYNLLAVTPLEQWIYLLTEK